jgi:hypothetical protein
LSPSSRFRASVAAVLLACLGCASGPAAPAVSSTYDPLFRFPAQARYAWDDAAIQLPEDPAIDRAETDALLREAADEAFAARGWGRAAPPAEFRLSYHYVVNTRIAADYAKSVGSVSLLLVESASGRRVWMGFGRAEIYVGLTREERKARLRDALDRMLEKFPPSQRPEE